MRGLALSQNPFCKSEQNRPHCPSHSETGCRKKSRMILLSPARRSSAPRPDRSRQNAAPVARLESQGSPGYASIGARKAHARPWDGQARSRFLVRMQADRPAPAWLQRKRLLRRCGPGPSGSIECGAEELPMQPASGLPKQQILQNDCAVYEVIEKPATSASGPNAKCRTGQEKSVVWGRPDISPTCPK